MTPFPCQKRKRRKMPIRSRIKLLVYCKCRQPEEGKMIQCDCCAEWFHKDCIKVPEQKSDCSWLCDNCKL